MIPNLKYTLFTFFALACFESYTASTFDVSLYTMYLSSVGECVKGSKGFTTDSFYKKQDLPAYQHNQLLTLSLL